MATAVEAESDSPTFFTIPVEMRVQIYNDVFDMTLDPAYISAHVTPADLKKNAKARRAFIVRHPLLHASSQIRAEALSIFESQLEKHYQRASRLADDILLEGKRLPSIQSRTRDDKADWYARFIEQNARAADFTEPRYRVAMAVIGRSSFISAQDAAREMRRLDSRS